MSNPPPYLPSFSFSGYQETNPTDPLPGPMVDDELFNIAGSINTTITALSSVRRSDGALVNGIVTPESLSSDLTIGVQTPTAWVTAHAYTAGNLVVQSNKFYLCLVAHTSGVFATDLAAVKWVEVTLSITGYSADQVTYDHTASGLIATNVKTAIDEVDAKVDAVPATLVPLVSVATKTFTAAEQAQARTNISAALKGQIFGLTLSNNATDATNDIDIAIGEAASIGSPPVLMALAAATGKRLDAVWALGGTPAATLGGLDTGAVADGTYHVHLMQRSDTGVVDVCFSLSATAPTTGGTIPVAYDRFRRIGSIIRTGGSIVGFKQNGNKFRFWTSVNNISATNPGTAAATRTLTIPTGIVVEADIVAGINNGTTAIIYGLVTALDEIDRAPSINDFNFSCVSAGGTVNGNPQFVKTNTSAQIRSRQHASGVADIQKITTFGWVDTRGRDA